MRLSGCSYTQNKLIGSHIITLKLNCQYLKIYDKRMHHLTYELSVAILMSKHPIRWLFRNGHYATIFWTKQNIDGTSLYALNAMLHITYRGDKWAKLFASEAVDTIALSPVYLSFSCDLIVSYDSPIDFPDFMLIVLPTAGADFLSNIALYIFFTNAGSSLGAVTLLWLFFLSPLHNLYMSFWC